MAWWVILLIVLGSIVGAILLLFVDSFHRLHDERRFEALGVHPKEAQ
jgi:hypothetical protein